MKRSRTNPTLSIGAVPLRGSPQQEGVPVTPQVFASRLNTDAVLTWVHGHTARMQPLFCCLQNTAVYDRVYSILW